MSTTSKKKQKKKKKEQLSERDIRELMRHDSFERKGGSIRQKGWSR